MSKNLVRAALIALMPVVVSSTAFAESKTEAVHFKAGASSANLKGSVTGYDTHTYTIGAAAGQAMSVQFTGNNNACYMNIIAPGADSAFHRGEIDGNEYAGNLPADGDYRIEVYLMRSEARRNKTCKFSVAVEISGKAAAASGSATPSKNEQACLQAVSQAANNGDVATLSVETSEANDLVMIGVGPQRAPWKCLVNKGKVAEVMSMTDEGAL